MKKCSKCLQILSFDKFYNNKVKADGVGNYCRECHNTYVKQRWRDLKIKAIDFTGGKCQDCDGRYHRAVYDFHHLDPSIKDADWSKLKRKSWKSIVKELSKCVLLCSNCHRIRHALKE